MINSVILFPEWSGNEIFFVICTRFQKNLFQKRSPFSLGRDARVFEEARLESVYTPKVYRGFESRSLRSQIKEKSHYKYQDID